jgi:RNAse (barnase) inhibitor barstar
MRTIDLDAANWTTALDFYEALLAALGAPAEHGQNINALTDSLIWGGVNAIEPPYTIRIRHIGRAPKVVIREVELANQALSEARAQFRAQHGRDVDVQLEINSRA